MNDFLEWKQELHLMRSPIVELNRRMPVVDINNFRTSNMDTHEILVTD